MNKNNIHNADLECINSENFLCKLTLVNNSRKGNQLLLKFKVPNNKHKRRSSLIEGFHKNLKRRTKRKEQFPNEDSLEGYVCSFCSDYNQRFGTRIHKGFAQVSAELNDLFD